MYAITRLLILRKIYGQSYFIIIFPSGQENIRIVDLIFSFVQCCRRAFTPFCWPVSEAEPKYFGKLVKAAGKSQKNSAKRK